MRIKDPRQINARRVRYVFFTLIVWLTVSGQAVGYSPFTELSRDHWSYAAVEKLFALGLVDEHASNFYQLGYSVSRYEMAIWVASVLQTLSSGEEVALDNRSQALDLEKMVTLHNGKNGAAPLAAADLRTLRDLISFLNEELSELGYAFVPDVKAPAQASLNPGTVVLSTFVNNRNENTNSPKSSAAKAANSPTASVWESNSRLAGSATTAPQWGLTLELGDLSLSAGKKVDSESSSELAANAIGLTYRMQKVNFELGFANASRWRAASAGVRYNLAPTSLAEAGLSLTSNTAAGATTADFGLRYKLDDASLSLGYRLVDLADDQLPSVNESHNNVATAEFSIRF